MRKPPGEEVREKLVKGGMDPKLVDRFIRETLKEKHFHNYVNLIDA